MLHAACRAGLGCGIEVARVQSQSCARCRCGVRVSHPFPLGDPVPPRLCPALKQRAAPVPRLECLGVPHSAAAAALRSVLASSFQRGRGVRNINGEKSQTGTGSTNTGVVRFVLHFAQNTLGMRTGNAACLWCVRTANSPHRHWMNAPLVGQQTWYVCIAGGDSIAFTYFLRSIFRSIFQSHC